MLIRFSVENFLSFSTRTEFSMVAAKNLPHDDQLLTSEDPRVLRGSVLYGANAAGKSNLVKAIAVARNMIVTSDRKKPRLGDYRFRMSKHFREQPMQFEFDIIVKGKIYSYGFTFGPNRIEEEWLYVQTGTKERAIFVRNNDELDLDDKTFKERSTVERLKYTFDDLFPDQLFLTAVNNRNTKNLVGVEVLTETYSWFDERLIVLFPESRFLPWQNIEADEKLQTLMREMLSALDTGIDGIEFVDRSRDEISEADLPEDLLDEILADTNNDRSLVAGPRYNSYIIDNTGENLLIKELCTWHETDDGPVTLSLADESDGTKRVTDLIPLLYARGANDLTFVIDEIDRSLHPALTYRLLDLFLHGSGDNRSQLIATTHDVNLINLKLLRKDEIWFVQKRKDNSTELYSLQDFKPRKDLQVKKAYLHGRFGAVPNIQDHRTETAIEEFR